MNNEDQLHISFKNWVINMTTETKTELCLSVSCGGLGQQWTAAGTGALGAADLGMA